MTSRGSVNTFEIQSDEVILMVGDGETFYLLDSWPLESAFCMENRLTEF
jgi:hypothetical protein